MKHAAPPTTRARSSAAARVELETTNARAEAEALAKKMFDANKAKNEANRIYEASRKELAKEMRRLGITQFRVAHQNSEGQAIMLESLLETPVREVIDIEALQKQVTAAQFLDIVTASKKAVEDKAGKTVLARCITTVAGTENVSVDQV